jgi:hypothetical protein
LRLEGDGDRTIVDGGHVPQPTQLADVLEVIDAAALPAARPLERPGQHRRQAQLDRPLNYHLNAIDGVVDGAFWMPPSAPATRRSCAGRVRGRTAAERQRDRRSAAPAVDAAFLPRRIVQVASLPRDPTGKLPAERLAASPRRRARAAAAPAHRPHAAR